MTLIQTSPRVGNRVSGCWSGCLCLRHRGQSEALGGDQVMRVEPQERVWCPYKRGPGELPPLAPREDFVRRCVREPETGSYQRGSAAS